MTDGQHKPLDYECEERATELREILSNWDAASGEAIRAAMAAAAATLDDFDERVVFAAELADVTFAAAFTALLDAAQHTGARILPSITMVAVERGRRAEMAYSDIVTAIHVAAMEAVTAHAESEAERK